MRLGQLAFAFLPLASTAATAESVSSSAPLPHDRQYYEKEFVSWMNTFKKEFHQAEDFVHRLNIFQKNDQFIQSHNEQQSPDFLLGHNEFSHLSWEEFRLHHFGLDLPSDYVLDRTTNVASTIANNQTLPESVDWVAKGGVTAVKNQGQCGSCWAFSTTGAVEGAAFVSSGTLENLSEQELVDCDTVADQGCGGGLMDHAFKWIENRGLCREQDYPYHAKAGICALNCAPVVQVTGFTDVPSSDEAALQAAVAQQPVSVAIEADQPAFQFYKSGVFTKACGTKLDHGVLVVGYGSENGSDFFLVKNSWGNTWGEKGFIKLARNIGVPEGQCGVAMVPSYPTAHVIQKNDVIQTPPNDVTLDSSAIIETCAEVTTCVVHFTSLSVTPEAPKRGKPIHFAGTGMINKAFGNSTFDLQVRLAGEEVFAHTGSMCGDTHIPLPLHLGHINVHGFQCPVPHGKFDNVAVDVNLPIIAPSGNYEIRITSSDNSDQLFCINVKLDLTSSEEELVSSTGGVYEIM